MGRVERTELPEISALHARKAQTDFLDCYSVPSSMSPRQAGEIITDFPIWGKFLLVIRRIVTAPFGLDNDGPDVADKIGIFPVESETQSEVIAGFNDKHLDFRVSVLSHDGKVHLSTWVSPNNVGGRIYLAAIMPFHIAIARNGLKRVALATA